MDDAFLVRVLDGLAYLGEYFEPVCRGNTFLVTKLSELDATHKLHDEIRPARFRRAGLEDFGDVWMVHQRQGLPLSFEAGDDLFGVHAQLDDLERDSAADGLGLLGHIDHPAAAFADLLKEFVATNAVAGFFGDGDYSGLWLFGQKALARFVRAEQGLDSREQGSVFVARTCQKAKPFFGGRDVQRLLEDFLFAIGLIRDGNNANGFCHPTVRRAGRFWAKNLREFSSIPHKARRGRRPRCVWRCVQGFPGLWLLRHCAGWRKNGACLIG